MEKLQRVFRISCVNVLDLEFSSFERKYFPSGEKHVLLISYIPGPGTLFLRDLNLFECSGSKTLAPLFLYFDTK